MRKEEEKFTDSEIFEGMTSISAVIKASEANPQNNRRILKILIDIEKKKVKQREISFLSAKAQTMGFEINYVSAQEIEKYSVGNSHGGLLAICSHRNLPNLRLEDISSDGIYYLLEGIEDPYNFGYAVRSLYAFGATGLILSLRNWMGVAGVVARSSAGTSELLPIFVDDPVVSVRKFKEKGYRVICAGIRDSVPIWNSDLKKPLLVILGGEKRGISRSLLNLADQIVRIDYGKDFKGSLSTSAAVSVFGFEILRQNKFE